MDCKRILEVLETREGDLIDIMFEAEERALRNLDIEAQVWIWDDGTVSIEETAPGCARTYSKGWMVYYTTHKHDDYLYQWQEWDAKYEEYGPVDVDACIEDNWHFLYGRYEESIQDTIREVTEYGEL